MARRILVVDDNDINRALLRNSLGKEYDIIEAVNGEDALKVIHRQYKVLSAVLLDIMMPVMDGYEVLRRIRENPLLGQIPVIVVTGSEDDETRVKALSLGANDFITKPFNADIIRHCLRNNIALRETASIVNAIQKDKLTGIYNREFFFEKAGEMIRSREPGYYILACIDIDNFKLVNDQYGTTEGDRILKYAAAAFQGMTDHVGGLCGRISGDNFAVLYPNTPESVDYVTAGHGVRYLPKDFPAILFVSVGRYVIKDCSLPVSALYDRAFIAKQSVKGRYDQHIAYFDESMLRSLAKEQQIVSDMDYAIRNHQFEVWYQPQYNHLNGAMIGAEALVRWRHPDKGLVPPGDFIPVFERNGFVFELDKYVWEQAVKGLRQRMDAGRRVLPVSVNVSRYDVFKEELIDILTGLVQKYDVPVSLLRLEITESAFSKSAAQIIAVVQRLLGAGFTVEIDDFGSGYSSLNTLKDVPAQVLKLDMRFLENTVNTRRGGNILESIVRMARWLDMSVIAEGVETVEQADYLKTIGCTSVQGYLYAKPMPFDEFTALADGSRTDGDASALKTIANLDSNAFWDPKSMDTLIFNSYVGSACVFEHYDGRIEFLRVNDKYSQALGVPTDALMKVDWLQHMAKKSAATFEAAIASSARTHEEFTGEYLFLDIPGCPRELYLRSTLRVIASAGERLLIYCISENITKQRAAERRLKESGAQLRILADSLPGGLATYRYKDGRFDVVFFNDGFCRLFGCTRDEYNAAATKDAFSHVLPEDLPALRSQLELLVRTGAPVNCSYRIRGQDGVRWIKHRGAIAEKEKDSLIINAVLFDMTEEHEATERLRISAEEYRLAVRHSGTVICRFDILGRTSAIESETARKFGLPEIIEDVPYAQVRQGLVAPESEKTYIDFYEAIIGGAASGEALYRYQFADGLRWVEARYSTIFSDGGKPLLALLSFLDVTERLEKEAVYQKWQQSLKEKSPASYALYRCNLSREPIVEKMSGDLMNAELDRKHQGLDERTAEYVRRFVYPDDQEDFAALLNIDALLAGYFRGKRAASLDYREMLGNGNVRWMRLSVELLERIGSSDVEARLMFEDIDVEKRAALDALEQTETDPLTGALNRAAFEKRMTERMLAVNAPRQCALMMMDVDGFKLVNDFLGHAVGDRALADIAGTLRGILRKEDLLGRLGGDEFLIFLNDIPDESVAVGKARQICALVRKTFSADVQISGSIGIVMCPRDGRDFDLLYQKADAAMYFVKDAGRDNYAVYHEGMEEEEEAAHGVRLLAPQLPRMLIVDDNQMDFAMLENIFKRDYRIEKARDGASALIRLRHYGTAIRVVLLDLRMPGMDGFAVLEKMQRSAELRLIPVVVVSGAEAPDTNLRALQCGAADFVVKPVVPDILRVRVNSAVNRADNERLRAQNSLAEMQSDEARRYKTVLHRNGIYVIEHDWVKNTFVYDQALGDVLAGTFNDRKLWHILLSDMVADTATVKQMQELVHDLAADKKRLERSLFVRLKLTNRSWRWFVFRVYKATDDFGLTDKLLLTFAERGDEKPPEADAGEAGE